jgi:hypothetical protein
MPVRQHWCNDIVPHVQHLVVLVHVRCTMTSSGSESSRDCESRSVWIQSEFPQHFIVQQWSHPHSDAALRGATQERERERERERRVAHGGEERRALPRSSLNPLVSNSPLGVP